MGKECDYYSFIFFIWTWFAVLGWLVITLNLFYAKVFPSWKYYDPKLFEISGKIYVISGVRIFRKFMYNGDYYNRVIRVFKPAHKIIRNQDSMIKWEKRTRSKELGHLIHFVIGLIAFIYVLITGHFITAIYIAVFNIIFNLYPIMLQRYNRARIYKIIAKYLQ